MKKPDGRREDQSNDDTCPSQLFYTLHILSSSHVYSLTFSDIFFHFFLNIHSTTHFYLSQKILEENGVVSVSGYGNPHLLHLLQA